MLNTNVSTCSRKFLNLPLKLMTDKVFTSVGFNCGIFFVLQGSQALTKSSGWRCPTRTWSQCPISCSTKGA